MMTFLLYRNDLSAHQISLESAKSLRKWAKKSPRYSKTIEEKGVGTLSNSIRLENYKTKLA